MNITDSLTFVDQLQYLYKIIWSIWLIIKEHLISSEHGPNGMPTRDNRYLSSIGRANFGFQRQKEPRLTFLYFILSWSRHVGLTAYRYNINYIFHKFSDFRSKIIIIRGKSNILSCGYFDHAHNLNTCYQVKFKDTSKWLFQVHATSRFNTSNMIK